VKLLGDGAMLSFPDAKRGLEAALDLVRALTVGWQCERADPALLKGIADPVSLFRVRVRGK
jgi:class 3 adenylate cyclase